MRLFICLLLATALIGAERPYTIFPETPASLRILRHGESLAEISFAGWGKGWKPYYGFAGKISTAGETTTIALGAGAKKGADPLTLTTTLTQPDPRHLRLAVEFATTVDVDLTYIVLNLAVSEQAIPAGTVTADGGQGVPLPLDKQGLGKATGATWKAADGGVALRMSLDRAHTLASDGALRVVLADKTMKAGAKTTSVITLELPEDATWLPDTSTIPHEAGFDQWYAFQPGTDWTKPSELGMEAFSPEPAGAQGRITRDGDHLLYGGKPIKLWGLNLCYGNITPDKAVAEQRARWYRRYGINAVRLHKYGQMTSVLSKTSWTQFDPAGLDKMDYLIAKLKEAGIFVKLSATFGVPEVKSDDLKRFPWLAEFAKGGKPGKDGLTPPHSSVYYSTELQDLVIEHFTNLLAHKNPHTGLTYAQDPAVAMLECLNEQSALFYSSWEPLKSSPTLRKRIAGQFGTWLRKRYGSAAALEKAWGAEALNSFAKDGFPETESWAGDISPAGTPWFWDPDQLAGSQAFRKQRLLDSMVFIGELQAACYERFATAMRAAGYTGLLTASNWQAGRAYSHYTNLAGDATLDLIDRHNYFSGGGNRIPQASMLKNPGSGMLSSGMQQVASHPFMLSEWIHVSPSEWGAEGVAIIGAYGMGLQGWDVSFLFQNGDDGGFKAPINSHRWEASTPQIMAAFPAIARLVRRGDVQQASVTAVRKVHLPSLGQGKLSFDDQVQQGYDDKTFGSDKVQAATLAVARCTVEFTKDDEDTQAFDLKPYAKDGWLLSSTGQLRWKAGTEAASGGIAIDTPATQGVVGFLKDQQVTLGDLRITSSNRYAVIYVTAQKPTATLKTAKTALVVAMARVRNTDMKVFNGDTILTKGTAPTVFEPVRADLRLARAGATIELLDHAGARTGRMLPVDGGAVAIDTARDRTPYYLITWP